MASSLSLAVLRLVHCGKLSGHRRYAAKEDRFQELTAGQQPHRSRDPVHMLYFDLRGVMVFKLLLCHSPGDGLNSPELCLTGPCMQLKYILKVLYNYTVVLYLSVPENKIVHLLSVALALRAIAAAFLHVPLHLSLVPAFSCDLLCYPEWRKEQNHPYLSLVNALHEGEIVEMLRLKKKQPPVCIFVLFSHLWGIGSFEV
ncbi:hypothetical protein MJG53_008988 [Ovis ammon polii x Ovis aries]|uniref:Uncharacterized protein n=1 Tax=Ovis ammon polii x Ovis aries TaxID=2918886 RepID=A0ACB9UXU5_9CETA|nr:hypothetical protein MJT46_008621 [Ovis ammon polii x Ovis aries]KAI4582437.1 hypothetical protein MJG53_008988 [Ovis ammon polii x Ovis aries]